MFLSRPLGSSLGSLGVPFDEYSVHCLGFTKSGIQEQDDGSPSESIVLGKCLQLLLPALLVFSLYS